MLDMFIPGEVAGQGSLQLYRGRAGQEVAKHPPKTVLWRNHVSQRIEAEWGGRRAYAGAVRVTLTALYARPKSHFGSGRNSGAVKDSSPFFMMQYPDIDKVSRLHLDALVIAGVLEDDKQVVSLVAKKHWSDPQERAGVRIVVEAL